MRNLLVDLIKVYKKTDTVFSGELEGSTTVSLLFPKPFYVEVRSSVVANQILSIFGSGIREDLTIDDDYVAGSVLMTDIVSLSSSARSDYVVKLVSAEGSPVFAYKLERTVRGRFYRPQDQTVWEELGELAKTTKFLVIQYPISQDSVIECAGKFYSIDSLEVKRRRSSISHCQLKLRELTQMP